MDKVTIYVATHKKIDVTLIAGYTLCQVNAEKTGQWD